MNKGPIQNHSSTVHAYKIRNQRTKKRSVSCLRDLSAGLAQESSGLFRTTSLSCERTGGARRQIVFCTWFFFESLSSTWVERHITDRFRGLTSNPLQALSKIARVRRFGIPGGIQRVSAMPRPLRPLVHYTACDGYGTESHSLLSSRFLDALSVRHIAQ